MGTRQRWVSLSFAGLVLAAALSAKAAPISTTNLLTNPGAETGDLTGWTVGGTSNPGVDNGRFDNGINPHSGSYDFYGGTGPFGSLSQSIALIGDQGITAAAINAGTLFVDVSFWEQGLNQGTPSDEAQITLTFLDATNAVLGTVTTPLVDSHNLSWEEETESFAIPKQTASVQYTMDFLRNVGSDNDSFIDDNSLTVSGGSMAPTGAPEPGTLALLGTGCLLLAKRFRARR